MIKHKFFLFIVCWLVACTADIEPIAITRPVETAVAPISAPTLAPAPTETADSIIPLPTATLAITPSPTQTAEAAITWQSVFQGGDVRLLGWSPDGRYFAYFEYSQEQLAQAPPYPGGAEGTFTIYDTASGSKCQGYSLSGKFANEGPAIGRYLWLPNGHLLIVTENGDTFQDASPCPEQQAPIFSQPISNIASSSPDEGTIILSGADSYWFYDWQQQTMRLMTAEIVPDPYNSIAWSPNGRYLAITSIDYNKDPIGSTWMIEVATGNITARHDWQAMTAVDGILGSPVWLNNEEVLISATQDGEPFFMTVAGDLRPLLPIFPPADRDIPLAQVYVNSDSYHILLTDFGAATPPLQIYHANTDEVETLPTATTNVYLRSDGQIVADSGEASYWTRHITAVGASPSTEQASCYPAWYTPTAPYNA